MSKVPEAIATAGAETPNAVSPLRVGIGAGVLVGAFLFVVYMIHAVPSRMISLVGGPEDELGRRGGLALTWAPPPEMSDLHGIQAIEARFRAAGVNRAKLRREGESFVIEVPGVDERNIDEVSRRIGLGTDGLGFHEVVEAREMADLKTVLDLPMTGAKPVDLETDFWRPDEGGEGHTDFYLLGETREVVENAIKVAQGKGWTLPPGTRIAFEHMRSWETGEILGWRTYVIVEKAVLDGDSIANAAQATDPYMNRPIVLLDFTRDAAQIFADLTARIAGHKLAIVVDGLVVSAPVINMAIRGGRASINMGGSDPVQQQRDADVLAATLRAPLPSGGQVRAKRWVPPGDTTGKVWISRIVIALGGGVLTGLVAWALISRTRPSRRRAPARGAGAIPWQRLAITLLAPVAVFAASKIPMLGIDFENADDFGDMLKAKMNVGTLGLGPLLTAFVLAELVALVVPPWRRRRHAGGAARAPITNLVIGLTFGLVVLQGWFILFYVERLGVMSPELAPRIYAIGSLVVATLAFAVVAHVIRRHGLGNGFGALFVSGWIMGTVYPWLSHDELTASDHLVAIASFVMLCVPFVFALRWRVANVGEAPVRIPTSGIGPISNGSGLLVILVLLTTLPIGDLAYELNDWQRTLWSHQSWLVALVLATTLLWSFAFARPRVFERIASRAGLSSPANQAFWRATSLSFALLLFAFWPVLLGGAIGFSGFADPVSVAILVAVVLDLVDDLRARRGNVVTVWSLHQAQYADVVAHALEHANIPCHLASSHLRTLLAFFGPFAPIDVLVPAEHATAAHAKVAALFKPQRP